MAQNKILIIAQTERQVQEIVNAFNLRNSTWRYLTEHSFENMHTLRGIQFDTLIVHMSFKHFTTGQHLLNQIAYYSRLPEKIFYVEEDFPNV